MHWFMLILGLIFGSFFNVLIWRIPNKISIRHPGSHCPECKEPLSIWELIPVFSYLIQKGLCRHCQTKIDILYPIVELFTGLGFYFFSLYSLSWQDLLVKLVFFSLLVIAGIIDIRTKLLPNIITIPGIMIGLFFAALGWSITLKSSLLGILVSGGILLLIAIISKGGMGMGDVKYFALIGTFIGPQASVIALFLASFSGAVFGILYLYITKKDRKTPIPFGPFLMLGALITYWYLFLP